MGALQFVVFLFIAHTTNSLVPAENKNRLEADESETEWCPSWKNVICGSDGKNYWNECLFQYAQNKSANKNLIAVQAGICEEPECPECAVQSNLLLYRVCAGNNKRLPDLCTLKCHQEDFPVLIEEYRGCTSSYPTPDEVEVATSETFLRMVEELLTRTITNLKSRNMTLRLDLENFQGQLNSRNITFKTIGRQGWMNEIKNVIAKDGFSVSAEVPSRFKFDLNTGGISLGYNKLFVMSGAIRARTNIDVNIHDILLELVADIRTSEQDCTKIMPVTLTLVQLNNFAMQTSSPLPPDFPIVQLEGFIKEKLFANINKALKTLIIPEMLRIGCLSWPKVGDSPCIGAFQTRFCSFDPPSNSASH